MGKFDCPIPVFYWVFFKNTNKNKMLLADPGEASGSHKRTDAWSWIVSFYWYMFMKEKKKIYTKREIISRCN